MFEHNEEDEDNEDSTEGEDSIEDEEDDHVIHSMEKEIIAIRFKIKRTKKRKVQSIHQYMILIEMRKMTMRVRAAKKLGHIMSQMRCRLEILDINCLKRNSTFNLVPFSKCYNFRQNHLFSELLEFLSFWQ